MPTHTVRPKTENNAKLQTAPKSSKKARDLIKAAVAKYGSYRAAAKELGLKNHGELSDLLRGKICDTPRIKAAIIRADRRAKRAWLMLPTPKRPAALDIEAIKAHVAMLSAAVETVHELLKVKT